MTDLFSDEKRAILIAMQADPDKNWQMWEFGKILPYTEFKTISTLVNQMRDDGLVSRYWQGVVGSSYPDWWEYELTEQGRTILPMRE